MFDCETNRTDDPDNQFLHYETFRLGCAVYFRLSNGVRHDEDWLTFFTPDQFWRFVKYYSEQGLSLHIYAHNIAFDLPVVYGLHELDGEHWDFQTVCLEPTPFILEGHWKGNPVKIYDTFNYMKSSLADIGKSVGLEKMPMPARDAPDDDWAVYCANDVEVTARALVALIDYHTTKIGPWATTGAGLAFNAFRSSFMIPKSVHCHTQADILEMERRAYYGGMVQCSWLGPMPEGEFYELDVASMYPSVMKGPMPSRLIPVKEEPDVYLLSSLLESYEACADVVVKTRYHRYPVRKGNKIVFPVGEYQTSLCGAELRRALESGEIVKVLKLSAYETLPIFNRYVDFFWAEKQAYEDAGDESRRTIAKLYLNSLYGKFGQKSEDWREWCPETFRYIEEQYGLEPLSLKMWHDEPPDLFRPVEPHDFYVNDLWLDVRRVVGKYEINVRKEEWFNSSPIIAACVTSAARVKLQRMVELTGVGSHYYSDTDSLFVSRDGYDRLIQAGVVRKAELGYLGLKKVWKDLTIYGPKDIKMEGKTRRKGVRPSAEVLDGATAYSILHDRQIDPDVHDYLVGGMFRQERFESILSQIRRYPDGRVQISDVVKILQRCPDNWRVPCTQSSSPGVTCTHPDCVRSGVQTGVFTSPLQFPEDA